MPSALELMNYGFIALFVALIYVCIKFHPEKPIKDDFPDSKPNLEAIARPELITKDECLDFIIKHIEESGDNVIGEKDVY